jgi:MraZ protein
MLTGKFTRSLDDKLRLAIPKPLRDAMGCPREGALYVAPGTDGCLALYPEEAFSQLAGRLARGSPTGSQVRAFTRLFYARAQRAELDGQGRIRIPADLAELAGLAGEVILIGAGGHLEVWAQERWDAYLAEKQPQYDEIAEAAFGGSEPTKPQE